MAWTPATGHTLASAPSGLALVQNFLNTAYVGQFQPVDPLVEVDDARAWLAEEFRHSAGAFGQIDPLTFNHRDVERLRELRAALRALVIDSDGPAASVGWQGPVVSTMIGVDGKLVLGPQGGGYRGFAGLVAIEMFVAQQAGVWSRLKICRNPPCAVAFYDRSRNSAAVWHDAKLCGNAHNLRASRQRRRSPISGVI